MAKARCIASRTVTRRNSKRRSPRWVRKIKHSLFVGFWVLAVAGLLGASVYSMAGF